MSRFLSCARKPSSESTTSFSDLQEELVIDILRRLPAKSLMCSACVSKTWLSIVSDPKFGKSHFQLASEAGTVCTKLLIIKYHWLKPSFRKKTGSFVPLRVESLDDNFAVKSFALACQEIEVMRPLHCCNGLLLLGRFDCKGFCVWNLSTGSYRLICDPCLTMKKQLVYIWRGFGYASNSDDYKFVIVAPANRNQIKIYIFSLRANNWRVVTAPPFLSRSVWGSSYAVGVFSNGSIHWIPRSSSIYAFDVEKEEMRIVALPHALQNDEDVRYSYTMTLVVHLGGHLCIRSEASMKGVVWVMKEYKDPTSWVKLFSFGRYDSLGGDELDACDSGDLQFITKSGTMVINKHGELYWIDCPNGGDPLCSKRIRHPVVLPMQLSLESVLEVIPYDETLVPVS